MAWCLVKHRDNFTFYLYLLHIYHFSESSIHSMIVVLTENVGKGKAMGNYEAIYLCVVLPINVTLTVQVPHFQGTLC
jgi:hypothetical protein